MWYHSWGQVIGATPPNGTKRAAMSGRAQCAYTKLSPESSVPNAPWLELITLGEYPYLINAAISVGDSQDFAWIIYAACRPTYAGEGRILVELAVAIKTVWSFHPDRVITNRSSPPSAVQAAPVIDIF